MVNNPTALAELADLSNQSSRLIQVLFENKESAGIIDPTISTHLLRMLHTIKGLAKMCELTPIAPLAHALETALAAATKDATQLSRSFVALFLKAIDSIHNSTNGAIDPGNIEQIIKDLSQKPKNNGQAPATGTKQNSLLQTLGLDPASKLSDLEQQALDTAYQKNQIVGSVVAHLQVQNIEKSVKQITDVITKNGTLIALFPSPTKEQGSDYSFIFIFSYNTDIEKLPTLLPFTGQLTIILADKTVKKQSLKGAQVSDEVIDLGRAQASPRLRRGKPVPPARPEEAGTAVSKDHPECFAPQNVSRDQAPKPPQTKSTSTFSFENLEQMLWEKKEDPVIHIPISKIDRLLDTHNKLISTKNKLEHTIKQLKGTPQTLETMLALDDNILQLEKYMKRSQEAILAARLVRADSIFEQLARMATQLAHEHSKQISFEMVGKDVEIDKSILDSLYTPLLHLLKNAVDHGIKKPEERQALGKNPTGSIVLSFAIQDNTVVVSMRDDGQGLDVQAIKQKAIAKGLLDSVAAATMGCQEVCNFIFYPGFSTKEQVSETSGRGIGMNTVKTSIQRMHGQLSMETQPGVGTTFSIIIPSYLSLQRLLRFMCCGRYFALSFATITEVIPFQPALLQQFETHYLYAWQQGPIKACFLKDLLGLNPIEQKKPPQTNVIILSRHGSTIALVADDIVGQEEIVVRPLPAPTEELFAFYAGHADFGDDKLVMIINVEKIFEVMSHDEPTKKPSV